jgi:DNA-directed RNA polymerase subunit N (RpoN/RPB10)
MTVPADGRHGGTEGRGFFVRCARCGQLIDDDNDEVVLEIYTADERNFDPNDPGPIVASFCATCTRQIEKEHERHDREVKAFRGDLERFGSS